MRRNDLVSETLTARVFTFFSLSSLYSHMLTKWMWLRWLKSPPAGWDSPASSCELSRQTVSSLLPSSSLSPPGPPSLPRLRCRAFWWRTRWNQPGAAWRQSRRTASTTQSWLWLESTCCSTMVSRKATSCSENTGLHLSFTVRVCVCVFF